MWLFRRSEILWGIMSIFFVLFGPCELSRCNRRPAEIATQKIPGNNGYAIKVSGDPKTYIPGKIYSVTLQGRKTANSVQKFVGFILVAEPSSNESDPLLRTRDAGSFQLQETTLSKISDECMRAVTQTSAIPKSEIQVLWQAPPPGNGCVQIRATVHEIRETWYMDDGELTKDICEADLEDPDLQPEPLDTCCACDEAKYEVTFQGLWSKHTHPKDFPSNNWHTHFSDLIGASHSSGYAMWEYNGIASEGLKLVAETGMTRKMEAEMKGQSDNIRTIIKARGLWYPNVNGSTFAVFRVDKKHHLVSLVSMLGPSPDWIVGVSRMELCLANCSWIGQKVYNLYPWDAGTDSGATYEAHNIETNPQEPIRQITSQYPDNENAPFFNPTGEPMKPVARITLTRQRLYDKSCTDDSESPTDQTEVEVFDLDSDRPECAVTDWSPYTPCSATCGKGFHMRNRQFKNPKAAMSVNCDRQLVQKAMCFSSGGPCHPGWETSEEQNLQDECATGPWSDWGECSVTCGKGFRARTRKYLDSRTRKRCYNQIMEKEECMADVSSCEHEESDPKCMVTQWSDWSPCSVTCGKGMKMRTRLFLNPQVQSMCNVELVQKTACMAEKPDCVLEPSDAEAVCLLPKQVGPCRGNFPRWYFDSVKKMCLQFVYGGCRGNQNNFERYQDCNRVCDVMKVPFDTVSTLPFNQQGTQPRVVASGPSVDCMVTEWSEWSQCSVTCGRGKRTRERFIKLPAQNGGKACPKKLKGRRKCSPKPCAKSTGDSSTAADTMVNDFHTSKRFRHRYQ